METRVRPALPADIRAINAIYNHYVRTSTCTWHLTEETEAGRTTWLSEPRAGPPGLGHRIRG
jgi:L-amino acid N-acyltransferase YncA